MATTTLVITYTPASAGVPFQATSFTVGGTAYASLTATNIRTAKVTMEGALKLLTGPGAGGTNVNPLPAGVRDDEVVA